MTISYCSVTIVTEDTICIAWPHHCKPHHQIHGIVVYVLLSSTAAKNHNNFFFIFIIFFTLNVPNLLYVLNFYPLDSILTKKKRQQKSFRRIVITSPFEHNILPMTVMDKYYKTTIFLILVLN